MIDLHNHSLFGQDDGAKTFEESIRMIEMAYEGGTRTIVLTPHRNHPCAFKATIDGLEAFNQLAAWAKTRYPDLTLVKGCEYYVSQIDQDTLNDLKTSTMGNSHYVLIEFPVMAALSTMLSAVHEIRIAGLHPIIAHIEVYQAINDTEAVVALRSEGALIQVTGSSFIGKRGKDEANWLLDLVESGFVDFIASDGHGVESRRPTLDKARDFLSNKVGKDAAELLFEKNGHAVINNMPVSYLNLQSQQGLSKYRHKKRKFGKKAVAAASFAGVLIVSATVVMAMNPIVLEQTGEMLKNEPDKPAAASSQTTQQKTTAVQNQPVGSVLGQSQPTSSTPSPPMTETSIKANTMSSITEGGSNVVANNQGEGGNRSPLSEAELVEKYKAELTALQAFYESKLKSQVIMAREELKGVKGEEEKNRLIGKYAALIGNLQNQSDEGVQKVLYNLQTALENQKYPIDSVKRARVEYANIKEVRKSYYLELLEQ